MPGRRTFEPVSPPFFADYTSDDYRCGSVWTSPTRFHFVDMQTTYSPAGYHPEQMNEVASNLPQNTYKPSGTMTGSQKPQSRPQSRDRASYRLFPSGPAHQPLSPRTLQQESLERAGSLHRRRSVSLDESARNNGETRRLLLQHSHLSLRRKQGSVPDVKTTMSTVQELPQDSPTFPAKFSYQPRVSEDGGHGRSSSAPEDFVKDIPRRQQPNSRQPSQERSVSRSESTAHGLGLTLQRNESVKTPKELRGEAQRKQHRNLRLKIEKPLPPRPGSIMQLSHQPNGLQRGNISLPSQSTAYSAMRQDSVSQATAFHESSASASHDDSYFPLSSDAKVRELMGLPPSGYEQARGRKPTPIDTRAPMINSPSLTLSPPSSKFQKNFPPVDLFNNTEKIDHATKALPQQPQQTHEEAPQSSTSAKSAPESSARESNASAPDMSLMPAGLRFAPANRSASTSRAPPPPMLEPRKWIPTSGPSTNSSVDEQSAQALATLAELSKQIDALYARHTSLRGERQQLSSAIIENLRDNKSGPDYANVLLDQHMSLAAVSSSMDICVAKLKSLECRKDEAIAKLSPKKPSYKNSKTDSMRSTASESSAYTTHSSPSLTSAPQPSPAASEIINMYGQPRQNAQQTPATNATKQPLFSQPEATQPQPYNEPPRRLNVKGVKAAKILGLVQEAEDEQHPASPNITLPPTTLRSKPSLPRVEADTKPSSPAPDRPLPVPPTPRGRTTAPSPPLARSLSRTTARKESGHDAYWNSRGSSRASSPEEREAQTPQEEDLGHAPRFSNVSKSHTDSMQTVHVYLSEPMMSSTQLSCIGEDRLSCVGEDDLLEYYRDLQ